MDVDLARTAVTVKLACYGPGAWIGPHTDIATTVATHTIPLNVDWPASWGGSLVLLRSERADDVGRAIPADTNASVAFRRSDWSWHAVQPVAHDAARPRTSLVVHFQR